MSNTVPQWDLLVLTADKNAQYAVEGLLERHQALGIRPVTRAKVLVHPRRDPAVLKEAHSFLRPFLSHAAYCLVVFDREGCGRTQARGRLETMVQRNLNANGWTGRSAVVVIDPELETWVWADSPDVDAILGWSAAGRDLRTWLAGRGLLAHGRPKPDRPKEAVEAALRESRTKRSSALYRDLDRRVNFQRCTDPAFRKLRATLENWFSAAGSQAV